MVRDTLKRASLSPQLLEIEISETLAMQDIEYTEKTFRDLADLGVILSIDDFGTGYSCLSALRRLPVHTLKIDRSLVRECLKKDGDSSVLMAVFGIVEALGLKALAEGVENPEELAVIKQFSCSRIQGHLFASPAPALSTSKVD
jgi:EAL domain-containing protein (putative c-di-GMP-specific phosphodiesterase class I)